MAQIKLSTGSKPPSKTQQSFSQTMTHGSHYHVSKVSKAAYLKAGSGVQRASGCSSSVNPNHTLLGLIAVKRGENTIKLQSSNSGGAPGTTGGQSGGGPAYHQGKAVKNQTWRPRSSVVMAGGSHGLKQHNFGSDLFNSTAPIKFFNNFAEDLTSLRDSFNAQGPNAAAAHTAAANHHQLHEKPNLFATSMRLNSTQIKDEAGAQGGSSKPKSAERTHNYLDGNQTSASKKKRIRQKIMNSSYINCNLASSSVTSENTTGNRPRFKKGTGAATKDHDKTRFLQGSQRSSYAHLSNKKSATAKFQGTGTSHQPIMQSSSSLSQDKFRTETSQKKGLRGGATHQTINQQVAPQPTQSETAEYPSEKKRQRSLRSSMLVTQSAMKCISTLLSESSKGAGQTFKKDAIKKSKGVASANLASTAGSAAAAALASMASAPQNQINSTSSLKLMLNPANISSSKQALSGPGGGLFTNQINHNPLQQTHGQVAFALPTFARVDLDKVNKRIKIKSGRSSSLGKGTAGTQMAATGTRTNLEASDPNFASIGNTSGKINLSNCLVQQAQQQHIALDTSTAIGSSNPTSNTTVPMTAVSGNNLPSDQPVHTKKTLKMKSPLKVKSSEKQSLIAHRENFNQTLTSDAFHEKVTAVAVCPSGINRAFAKSQLGDQRTTAASTNSFNPNFQPPQQTNLNQQQPTLVSFQTKKGQASNQAKNAISSQKKYKVNLVKTSGNVASSALNAPGQTAQTTVTSTAVGAGATAVAKNSASQVSLAIAKSKKQHHGLDRVVQLAQKQKQKHIKTLNHTQKMTNDPLNLTMNLEHPKLSNNSSALCLQQIQKASMGQLIKLQDLQPHNSQFDWTGLLANMLQENLKPKKSTSPALNAHEEAKPYDSKIAAEEIQNKTQPLPKNLIHYSNCKRPEIAPYGLEDSRLSQRGRHNHGQNQLQRPKVGNRNVEIAPVQLPGDPGSGSGAVDIELPTILTEVTSDNCGEENPSNLSTQRSPKQVSEDYEFGRLIGEGAYAVVRLAVKKSTGLVFAAKIYDKSKLVDEHRRQSVCREVLLMQRLCHNHIVEFHEAFETDSYVYVIMENVDGLSLHEFLKMQKAGKGDVLYDQTLPEEEAKRLIRQLVNVLAYLHSQGITHRDIKLENIILNKQNNIKVIDFGFSTHFQPQKKVKMFCGTPSYMAPEIVSRVEYFGPPADIWATGVLLFCLLNGYLPFKGQTDAELYRRIQRGSYKVFRDDLSDECLYVLKAMVNVNPETRGTAQELLKDNWFQVDSRRKLSHDEIRRQFKARMLEKLPQKKMKRTTICIPGATSTSNSNQIEFNGTGPSSVRARLNLQLTQTASPPSNHPDRSEVSNLNQEALLAYYNITGQSSSGQQSTTNKIGGTITSQTPTLQHPALNLPQQSQPQSNTWMMEGLGTTASSAPPSGGAHQIYTPYNAYTTE